MTAAILVLAYEMCVGNAVAKYNGMAYAVGRLTYTSREIEKCKKRYAETLKRVVE